MRKRTPEESIEEFLDSVSNDTAEFLARGPEADGGFRTAVFLHLNRTLETGSTLAQSAQSLGVAIGRSGISNAEEEQVFEELELLGPTLGAQYNVKNQHGICTKQWWKFWK